MKKLSILLSLFVIGVQLNAQRGYNYYKDSNRVGSPNSKAFGYFKKAYYDHMWTWTKDGADSAEHYLKLAIQEDSNYSAAYAFLAHVYQFQTYNEKDLDRKFALQKKYAEKAISFNPQTGDAYSVMSDVKWEERDTLSSLKLLRDAIAREPDNVGNYIFLAIRFTQMGAHDDSAIYYLHQLISLDNEYGQAYIKMGNIYFWNLKQYDSARKYYHKAIEVYNTVKPRDARMMEAYYWLGNMYQESSQQDSSIHYFEKLLKELEPSQFYTRELRLGQVYRALYNAHLVAANNRLTKLIQFSERQIALHASDAEMLNVILQENYMPIDVDSVEKKYALPLARNIQKIPSSDPYTRVFAICNESFLLFKLNRKREAMQLLEGFLVQAPKEPVVLFELGRMKILANETKAGLHYLLKAKQYLNHVVTPGAFRQELKGPDFEKVRNTAEYRKLLE